jgi:hypothetical protein
LYTRTNGALQRGSGDYFEVPVECRERQHPLEDAARAGEHEPAVAQVSATGGADEDAQRGGVGELDLAELEDDDPRVGPLRLAERVAQLSGRAQIQVAGDPQ